MVVGHYRSQRIGGFGKFLEPEVQDVDYAIADLLHVSEPLLLLIPANGETLSESLVYRRIGGGLDSAHALLADRYSRDLRLLLPPPLPVALAPASVPARLPL